MRGLLLARVDVLFNEDDGTGAPKDAPGGGAAMPPDGGLAHPRPAWAGWHGTREPPPAASGVAGRLPVSRAGGPRRVAVLARLGQRLARAPGPLPVVRAPRRWRSGTDCAPGGSSARAA